MFNQEIPTNVKEALFLFFGESNKIPEILNREDIKKSTDSKIYAYQQRKHRLVWKTLEIYDNNLLYFYQELEVKRIFIKGRFIEEFEKKEFFDKDRISEIWKEYLMMLYYERSKINIHKYFEELICDYYDEPSYKIDVYRHF